MFIGCVNRVTYSVRFMVAIFLKLVFMAGLGVESLDPWWAKGFGFEPYTTIYSYSYFSKLP